MSITVDDGALITKDPAGVQVYMFDWDADNLGTGVEIASQSIAITAVSPSTTDTALTQSTTGTGLGLVTGNRKVNVKLSAGTLGQLYQVTNQIVTNEVPSQTKERSVFVLIENL